MDKKEYLEGLKVAIRHLYKVESEYEKTTPIREVFLNKTVWEGEVETFNLIGHPDSQLCFGWGHIENNNLEYIAILKKSPIDTPLDAVRAFIISPKRNF